LKNIFTTIGKYSRKGIIFVWDFIFFFFGMPYEKQASKLKLDKLDHIFRGGENKQSTHKIYRANKVSSKE
jgi:hypothetical protein